MTRQRSGHLKQRCEFCQTGYVRRFKSRFCSKRCMLLHRHRQAGRGWLPEAVAWLEENRPLVDGIHYLTDLYNEEAARRGWPQRTYCAITQALWRRQIAKRGKRVIDLDTQRVYPSARAAAAELFVCPQSIYNAIRLQRPCVGHRLAYLVDIETRPSLRRSER